MNRKQELDAALAPYQVDSHPRLRELARTGIPMHIARRIARLYGPVNAASPQIMAAGIAQVTELDLIIPLVDNLYDECGRGRREDSHTVMFERFMIAVDIDPRACTLEPDSLSDRVIQRFLQVCREGPDYRALAILHGFEEVFPGLCAAIHTGLVTIGSASPESAMFFSHHAECDIEHANRMREVMMKLADTPAKWQECLQLSAEGASLIHALFTECVASA
jgi:pyrroloquinoline-quinone synthase